LDIRNQRSCLAGDDPRRLQQPPADLVSSQRCNRDRQKTFRKRNCFRREADHSARTDRQAEPLKRREVSEAPRGRRGRSLDLQGVKVIVAADRQVDLSIDSQCLVVFDVANPIRISDCIDALWIRTSCS
jgi:hypothetical protein